MCKNERHKSFFPLWTQTLHCGSEDLSGLLKEANELLRSSGNHKSGCTAAEGGFVAASLGEHPRAEGHLLKDSFRLSTIPVELHLPYPRPQLYLLRAKDLPWVREGSKGESRICAAGKQSLTDFLAQINTLRRKATVMSGGVWVEEEQGFVAAGTAAEPKKGADLLPGSYELGMEIKKFWLYRHEDVSQLTGPRH